MLMRHRSRHIALPLRVVQGLMGGCDMGGVELGDGGERLYGRIIAHHEIENGPEEMRVLGG